LATRSDEGSGGMIRVYECGCSAGGDNVAYSCVLQCGHELWVTAKRKPTSITKECTQCEERKEGGR